MSSTTLSIWHATKLAFELNSWYLADNDSILVCGKHV